MFTNIFCLRKYSFSPFRLFFHSSTALMPFLHECLLRKACTPGLPFFSLPSFSRAGWGWVVLGCSCVASRGFSSPPARLWSSGRGGGASGRSFGAWELASVSLVRSWTMDSGVALWRRTLLPVLSRLALPPQLCTLGEVLGRESLRGRALFSVASPALSLHAQRGGGAGESSECRSS